MASGPNQSGRAGGARQLGSLDEAIRLLGLPLDNHRIVRQTMGAIGISEYHSTSSYIKAVRVGGGRDLHIALGYTNGFVSEEEAAAAGGRGNVGHSARGWLVMHPTNAIREGGETRSAIVERDYGTCGRCFTAKAASGACMCT